MKLLVAHGTHVIVWREMSGCWPCKGWQFHPTPNQLHDCVHAPVMCVQRNLCAQEQLLEQALMMLWVHREKVTNHVICCTGSTCCSICILPHILRGCAYGLQNAQSFSNLCYKYSAALRRYTWAPHPAQLLSWNVVLSSL